MSIISKNLEEALGTSHPIRLIRKDTKGWCYFNHKTFLSHSNYIKSNCPNLKKELIAIGESWMHHIHTHESSGISKLDVKKALWKSVPRQKYMAYLPWATAMSGDEKYLRKAIKEFDDFYDHAGDWFIIPTIERKKRMHGPCIGRLLEFLTIFYSIVDKEKINENFLSRLSFFLIQHSEIIFYRQKRMYESNVTFFNLLAVLHVSFALPFWKNGKKMRKDILKDLYHCMEVQFRADGGHLEQSVNYARAMLRSCAKLFYLCRYNKVPVPKRILRRYQLGGEALFQFYDGVRYFVDVGDSHKNLSLDWVLPWLNIGLPEDLKVDLKYPNHFSWVILGMFDQHKPVKKTARRLKLKTTLLKQSGYAFIRSKGNEEQKLMLVDTGPHGHYHGHYDLLSIVLHVNGEALLPDPGIYAFDSSPQRQAILSTNMHSTINLDGQNHNTYEDDEIHLAKVSYWNQKKDFLQISTFHDGYAHYTGKPRITRQIWYDYKNTWFILDRIICRSRKRRARHFAFISNFNLPTENDYYLETDLSSLVTNIDHTHNIKISIFQPENLDHIHTLPSIRNGKNGPASCHRLQLVTNTYSSYHLTCIQVFKNSEPSVFWENSCISTTGTAKFEAIVDGKKVKISFDKPA